jgi:hypothetical protein
VGMTQYYYNCSDSAVTVCPIYVGDPGDINAGTNYAYCAQAQTVGAWSEVAWSYSSTFTNGDYSTAEISNYLSTDGTTGSDPDGTPCNTSFNGPNGPGGYLVIYYYNCSSYEDTLCPIYSSAPGSLLTATNYAYCYSDEVDNLLPNTYPGGPNNASWYSPTTFTTGNYSMALYA